MPVTSGEHVLRAACVMTADALCRGDRIGPTLSGVAIYALSGLKSTTLQGAVRTDLFVREAVNGWMSIGPVLRNAQRMLLQFDPDVCVSQVAAFNLTRATWTFDRETLTVRPDAICVGQGRSAAGIGLKCLGKLPGVTPDDRSHHHLTGDGASQRKKRCNLSVRCNGDLNDCPILRGVKTRGKSEPVGRILRESIVLQLRVESLTVAAEVNRDRGVAEGEGKLQRVHENKKRQDFIKSGRFVFR